MTQGVPLTRPRPDAAWTVHPVRLAFELRRRLQHCEERIADAKTRGDHQAAAENAHVAAFYRLQLKQYEEASIA